MILKHNLLLVVLVVLISTDRATSRYLVNYNIGRTDAVTGRPYVSSSTYSSQFVYDNQQLNSLYPSDRGSWPEGTSFIFDQVHRDDQDGWRHRFSQDIVVSDAEYQQILEQLQQEAENEGSNNKIKHVSNDESIAEINRRFEALEESQQGQQQQQHQQEASEKITEGPIRDESRGQTADIRSTDSTSSEPEPPRRKLEECSICLASIEQRTPIIPCGHKFHRDCLISWMRQNTEPASKCPICRESLQFPKQEQ